jgi:Tol biopolymer transport system component
MEIKFNCPNPTCQQRISVDESRAGQTLSCPACATLLQAPTSPNIKFNCSTEGCGQHILVDVSEAGRFVRCPSCGKPSQVPGAPPKPIIASKLSQTPTEKPVFPSSKKSGVPRVYSPFMRLLCGWGTGAALCGIVMIGLHLRAWAALPAHLDAILDETYFHGEILTAPAVNHAGTSLLYVRTIESGVGVFLVNLTTLARTPIALGKAADHERGGAVKLFGWSPDDAFLAFSTIQDGKDNRHVVICNGQSGKEVSSFDSPQPLEMGTWLTANSLVLMDNSRNSRNLLLFNAVEDSQWGDSGKKGLVPLRRLDRTANGLVADSTESIAYVEKGNVWHMDIPDKNTYQLTHLTNSTLESLDYSPANHKYLFGLTVGASTNKLLYQCDANGNETPVVPENCKNYEFKGQWLQDGTGIAYVGMLGNRYYLAVATESQGLRTNLFTARELDPNWGRLAQKTFMEGRQVVRSFSVNPKREKIYTVASVNYEPLAIWEYDVASQTIRNVVPVKEQLLFSQFIIPVQASITNQSRVNIGYYFIPPVRLDPKKKYPVVMDVFSDLGFQPSSQFLANLGIFFVAVNPYGSGSPERPTLPEEMLAVYQEMLKNPNIDPKRIYLSGESAGAYTIARLLEDHPDFWRGALLFSPVVFQQVSAKLEMVPSIFFSVGTEDDRVPLVSMQQYALVACAHHTLTQMDFGNAGHIFYAIDESKQRYKAAATFILEDR